MHCFSAIVAGQRSAAERTFTSGVDTKFGYFVSRGTLDIGILLSEFVEHGLYFLVGHVSSLRLHYDMSR